MSITIHPIHRLQGASSHGVLEVPGDKSISHRALIFGAIANGTTEVTHLLKSDDVQSTWNALQLLGVEISQPSPSTVKILGLGKAGFKKPSQPLDCGNSGTTFRLLMGVLSGYDFMTSLIGDASLSKRPMARIAQPLSQMGAQFQLTRQQFAPIQIQGTRNLNAIQFELPTSSAQLKSALLLAGLYAQGTTLLRGKILSRDHTERLLPHFGAKILCNPNEIQLEGPQDLQASSIRVPGDLSSAAFWIAAAVLVPGSHLELRNISLNPTRTGFLKVLERMGAKIEIEVTSHMPEPFGTIRARYSQLNSTHVLSEEVPLLIDELPLLAVLALFAEGTTRVEGAQELRVKETDRIEAIASNIRALKGSIETLHDGFSITGPQIIQGGKVYSYHDHRIAMAMSIVALKAKDAVEVIEPECVSISYPGFFSTLKELVS